jgi:hypothetical protein
LQQEKVFGVTYELTVKQRRNRDLEGRDDRQMTVLNFNSYVQNLHFLVFQTDGQTDGQIDRQMEILIRVRLGSYVPPNTLAAHGIRSAKQDDDYGASNIILPCPGS